MFKNLKEDMKKYQNEDYENTNSWMKLQSNSICENKNLKRYGIS